MGFSYWGDSRAGLRGGGESSRIGSLYVGRFLLRLLTSFHLYGDWMESLFSDVRWRLYYGWVEVNFSLGSTTYSDVGGVGAGAFPLLI